MGFKVVGSLSNVRPAKTDEALLETTPTKGNIKLNAPGAMKVGVTVEDYVAVVVAQDENETKPSIYLMKGNAANEEAKIKQVGSILSGKSGGSLLFSSENAYRELGGNPSTKAIFTIGDARVEDGVSYFKLTFKEETAKSERKAKATA